LYSGCPDQNFAEVDITATAAVTIAGQTDWNEKSKLVRAMSPKGCSTDNAEFEGLFGRIKNEMFYNRS